MRTLSLKEDIDNILEFILLQTKLSKEEVFKLSNQVFSHVLHNYSDLNILTIDKFTYKIVKTFASDLGLTNNFELELDSNKIIKPAIASFFDRITENDKELVNVLLEYSSQKLLMVVVIILRMTLKVLQNNFLEKRISMIIYLLKNT